jgi:hypothetical protein
MRYGVSERAAPSDFDREVRQASAPDQETVPALTAISYRY